MIACACGSTELFAVKPGWDAEYGVARDLLGKEDRRLPPVLIRRARPDQAWCERCYRESNRMEAGRPK